MIRSLVRKMIAARTEEALMQKLPVDQNALWRAEKLLAPKNIKRLAIAVIGGSAAISFIGTVSEVRMYRRAMRRELKKQLEPIKKQLDTLEEQNEELKKQNEELRKKLAELEGHGFRR